MVEHSARRIDLMVLAATVFGVTVILNILGGIASHTGRKMGKKYTV